MHLKEQAGVPYVQHTRQHTKHSTAQRSAPDNKHRPKDNTNYGSTAAGRQRTRTRLPQLTSPAHSQVKPAQHSTVHDGWRPSVPPRRAQVRANLPNSASRPFLAQQRCRRPKICWGMGFKALERPGPRMRVQRAPGGGGGGGGGGDAVGKRTGGGGRQDMASGARALA